MTISNSHMVVTFDGVPGDYPQHAADRAALFLSVPEAWGLFSVVADSALPIIPQPAPETRGNVWPEWWPWR